MKRNYSSYRMMGSQRYVQSKGYRGQGRSIPRQVAWLTRQQRKARGTELAERNYVQYGISTMVDASTGSITHITNIATGTGLASRKDLKIKLSNLQYRYILTPADTVNTLRVLIVQSKAAITGVGTGDFFRSTSGGSALGFSEPANTENCFVLADHIIHAGDTNASCEGKITKFPQPVVEYTSTTGASVSRGGIYVLLWSDSNVVPHPTVQGFAKLKYFD